MMEKKIFKKIALIFSFSSLCASLVWAEDQPRPPKTVYPKETQLDYQGLAIEGEVRNPGELYFQHREEEKFDSLLKRRKNFHEQMLRDVMLSR